MLGALIYLLIYLLFAGVVFYLLWWLIGYAGVPEPFNKVARIVLAVFAVLVVLVLLYRTIGEPLP